ncbi:FAD-dependent monooxygenase [Actinomadura kijaniata]|uniref:FAD-dependent monooxygenase n=1 Tax=Actinomadura kijaniata TaxID=46161 RepID=UPI003F1B87C1
MRAPDQGVPPLLAFRRAALHWLLLEAVPEGWVRNDTEVTDLRSQDSGATFVHGNVALLGDAAHAMSPDRGQGAGQSIEDAVVPPWPTNPRSPTP